jgi:hypothetical protein
MASQVYLFLNYFASSFSVIVRSIGRPAGAPRAGRATISGRARVIAICRKIGRKILVFS